MKNTTDLAEGQLASERFALAGISALGPLVGASWGTSGLHLVTKAGRLLHCPGHAPTDGAWNCQAAAGAAVPMSPGAMLSAAAFAEHPEMGRTLALLFEDMPATVVLYKEDAARTSWMPAGEMHLPPGSRRAGLGFANDALMVIAEDGSVHHRPLRDEVIPAFIPAPASTVAREWPSACATSALQGGVLRLALRQGSIAAGANWRPELVVAAKTSTSSTPLVNV